MTHDEARGTSSSNDGAAREHALDRRTLLAAAGATAGLAGLSAVVGTWATPAISTASLVRPRTKGTLDLLVLGDTGWNSPEQERVATAMADTACAHDPAAVLLLGDNFYRDGVRSVDDAMWESHFERPFAASRLDVDFYAVLGNHDHNGDVEAQVDYTAKDRRWRMPARCYRVTMPFGAESRADFLMLDTTSMLRSWRSRRAQRAWLEAELSSSTADWKIVVGHHPARSNGAHGEAGGIDETAAVLDDLLRAGGVDLYLSGHDHDLQCIDSGAGWTQIVSGGGSSTRPLSAAPPPSDFGLASPGFARLTFEPDELELAFVDLDGNVVHERTMARRARSSGRRIASR